MTKFVFFCNFDKNPRSMEQVIFDSQDLEFLDNKNISVDKVLNQLNLFEKGFPFLSVIDSAKTDNNSIKQLNNIDRWIDEWNQYLSTNKRIIKFVPASGAATRMFKDLFEYLGNDSDSLTDNKLVDNFIKQIDRFAFFDDLDNICTEKHRQSASNLISASREREVIDLLLNKGGLNYGNLPKGLIKFHLYKNGDKRTPIEEHLAEGALYANNAGKVTIHFTVSEEHLDLFKSTIDKVVSNYTESLGVNFDISLSTQKGKTDTIAVDINNVPFRENGKLVFRPAGHGALLENLNDLDGDIVFIKNIDNVVPDSKKEIETVYKKAIAGYLTAIQSKVYKYLELLEAKNYSDADLREILCFLEDEFCIKNTDIESLNRDKLVSYITAKLNRPIRVCGMVKNIGEPGGGPFVIRDKDNSSSLQILESTQIDMSNAEVVSIYKKSSHFNPVDIVCGIRDYKGNKFDLREYTNPETGFISLKSKNGKELKALELPGLWNGAMADWNTVFVEVPLSVFNPVKTVFDLLRKEHQE